MGPRFYIRENGGSWRKEGWGSFAAIGRSRCPISPETLPCPQFYPQFPTCHPFYATNSPRQNTSFQRSFILCPWFLRVFTFLYISYIKRRAQKACEFSKYWLHFPIFSIYNDRLAVTDGDHLLTFGFVKRFYFIESFLELFCSPMRQDR